MNIRRTLFSLAILLLLSGSNLLAQEVPANLQAALFKKIFTFDKTLSAKGKVEVVVIGAGGDAIVSAFKDAGISAKTGDISSASSVVYIMPGTSSTKSQTASKGILSISGFSSYVEDGKVAIGLGVEGGKPKIIVNMTQLKAEDQDLSADLLKIAKVIH